MADKKNDVTREQLIILMAKYIKECSKKLSDTRSNVEVSMLHRNWMSCGKNRKWVNTEIKFNGNEYHFYDKEITDKDFLAIVNTALRESKCKGKVKTREWEEHNPNGWWYSPIKHIEFDGLTLLGKPCKEFVTLNRLLKKYTNKELEETEVNTSSVCGKRNSWSADSNSTGYLCYSPEKCKRAIEFIRTKRTSKDTLFFEVKNELYHGDEEDYRIAQYQESEWYGSEFNYLSLKVTTPGGKEKGNLVVRASLSCW